MNKIIGETVNVVIDRPLGSSHPDYKEMIYTVNYGYVEGIIANDNMEQDCYVLGVDKPLKTFTGKVIAVIKRLNDVEDKWIVSNKEFTDKEIIDQTRFTEQYFEIELIR